MQIIEALNRVNHWWRTGLVDQAFTPLIQRSEIERVFANYEINRIGCVCGPRRVGKSTLLFQCIKRLLNSGIEPRRLLYFSCDMPALDEYSLGEIIDEYISGILSENDYSIMSTTYIFIDEIHVKSNWQLFLKDYYDRKVNIRFVVSGSSAAHLYHDARESLLGRITDIVMLPARFYDFARMCNSPVADSVPAVDFSLDGALLFKTIKHDYPLWLHLKNSLQETLNEYLLCGGYPEYTILRDITLWQRLLEDEIISRGLFKDIVGTYNVRNPEQLVRLLYFVADNQNQEFSYNSISQTLNISADTVSFYIDCLDKAFFMNALDNYSTNAGKIIRKNKKLNVSDTGLRNALLRLSVLSPKDEGILIETAVQQQFRAYAENNTAKIYYWRQAQREIDLILQQGTGIYPIEVKYRNQIGGDSIDTLNYFKTAHPNARGGMIITKNTFEYQNGILLLPFYIFSLLK